MDRKNCNHYPTVLVSLHIRWCARCSGWQVRRVGQEPGLLSAIDSPVVYESHFLPVEETTPDELNALIQRAFRSAQEWEQDRKNQ